MVPDSTHYTERGFWVGENLLAILFDGSTNPADVLSAASYATSDDTAGGAASDDTTRDGGGAGTWRSGMGAAAKSRCTGFAISRAHWVDRDTRALSVDRPVLAYIWRYTLETRRNVARARHDLTTFARLQIALML